MKEKKTTRSAGMLERYQNEWLAGGSAVPLLELLVHLGREEHAMATARLALTMPSCPDREEVEAFLAVRENVPAGWSEAIDLFRNSPSEENWRAIVRFAPEESIYDWMRRAWRDLLTRGCDADAMIRYATSTGITPDAIGLVEEGRVSPEALIDRGSVPGAARSFWLGLAAEAAYQRDDRFRVISLLREARASETELTTPIHTVFFFREHADDAMREMMEKSGVWEWDL